MDDFVVSLIVEEFLLFLIFFSIVEEFLVFLLLIDDEKFEGGVIRILEFEDGIFEFFFSSIFGKR